MKISTKKQAALNDECTLICRQFDPDAADNDVPENGDKAEVFCGIFSIDENEYYEAAREGLRMVCGIVVRTDEENGADEVELYEKVYAVERKYRRVDGYTEIYLREKP